MIFSSDFGNFDIPKVDVHAEQSKGTLHKTDGALGQCPVLPISQGKAALLRAGMVRRQEPQDQPLAETAAPMVEAIKSGARPPRAQTR